MCQWQSLYQDFGSNFDLPRCISLAWEIWGKCAHDVSSTDLSIWITIIIKYNNNMSCKKLRWPWQPPIKNTICLLSGHSCGGYQMRGQKMQYNCTNNGSWCGGFLEKKVCKLVESWFNFRKESYAHHVASVLALNSAT